VRVIAGLCVFLAFPAYASETCCSAEWEAFVSHPGEEHYKVLSELLTECRTGQECEKELEPPSSILRQFLHLIHQRNVYALNIAFIALPIMGGGDLEDVVRELGLLVQDSPAQFLSLAKEHQVTEKELEALLTMLPEETVDNFDRQLALIEKRSKSIGSVKNPELASYRDRSLEILRREASSLRKIRSEVK
jgi:hypothetical protein